MRAIPVTSTAPAEMQRLMVEYQRAVDPGWLHQFACSLGLSTTSLMTLRIGWSTAHRAWCFPMTDARGNVLGIRLRRPNGYKFAITGGREGLFVPSSRTTIAVTHDSLFITEGPTDTAALLDMGFLNVAGRPSCTGGINLLVELVKVQQRPEVVIVADNDEPGQRGAANLQNVLLVYAPMVRVVAPPGGIKDVRAWLQAAGKREDMERAIQAAPARRGVVCGRLKRTERVGNA
jgi:hypothetical protein